MATDQEIVSAFVRYHRKIAEVDAWAGIELNKLAIDSPERAWALIEEINAVSAYGACSRSLIASSLGCGPIKRLVAQHERKMLPMILEAAQEDPMVLRELDWVPAGSISPTAWTLIRARVDPYKRERMLSVSMALAFVVIKVFGRLVLHRLLG